MNELSLSAKNEKIQECYELLKKGHTLRVSLNETNFFTSPLFISFSGSLLALFGIVAAQVAGVIIESPFLFFLGIACSFGAASGLISPAVNITQKKFFQYFSLEERKELEKLIELNEQKESLFQQYQQDPQIFCLNVFDSCAPELILRIKAGFARLPKEEDPDLALKNYLYDEVANHESKFHQELKSKIPHMPKILPHEGKV